jgi:hypothetical protein
VQLRRIHGSRERADSARATAARGKETTPMTIVYDPEKKRAMDAETGMAVEFVRMDYPMESGEFFKLVFRGREYPFRVSYSSGFERIVNEFPSLSTLEQSRMTSKLNLRTYSIGVIGGIEEDKAFLMEIDTFMSLFCEVVRRLTPSKNMEIEFSLYGVPKEYWRKLIFTPISQG